MKVNTVPRKKYTLFTAKALAFLIIPIVIESALTMSLGLVDSFMVKGIGEYGKAMSAVTNVDQISNVMVQLFAAFGTGGAIITSQYLGAGRNDDANKSAKQLYVLMFLAALAVMIICLVFNHQIIDLIYKSDDPVYKDYSYTYFYLMAASYPLLAVFYASAALLRAQRKSMNTMTSAAVSFVLNVGLNALFIYALDLGVLGAAIATCLSRLFPAVFLSVLLSNKKNLVRIKIFEKFRFNGKMIKKILILAIPSGIESCLFQVGKLMTASFVANNIYETVVSYTELGEPVYLNANNVATSLSLNINTIGSIVGNGINTSILTVIGQAVGTGDIRQTKHYMRKMLAISYIGNACCVGLTWALSPVLIGFFGTDITAETATIAQNCLHLCFAVQLITYPLSFGGPAVLKATSDVKFVMIAAIASMIIMRVGLCYFLTCDWAGLRMGAMGLWIGMVADWALRSSLFGGRILSGRWKKASGLLVENAAAETAAPSDGSDPSGGQPTISDENENEAAEEAAPTDDAR